MQNVNKVFSYKLVLLGESAVGKSSLVLRFVKGQFLEFQESTIGGMIMILFALVVANLLFLSGLLDTDCMFERNYGEV